MNIGLIGSGGREHALCETIIKSNGFESIEGRTQEGQQ